MKKSPYESQYIPADKYMIVNDNDPDLRPIVLSLPSPPPLRYIDGYGLPPEDQRFQRLVIPRRLVDLEAEAMEQTKKDLSVNKNNVITLLKIQKKFWVLLQERHKKLKKEIDFIRQTWWHRQHGYWFFNKGKPTYISGWHFFYLNFWVMETDDGGNRPEYRERDRDEYIFARYAETTTETFDRLDEHGYAIKEKDGSYKMKDMGLRICFGKIQPKNRRSGNTNKALSNGIEWVTKTIKSDGMGIQSYSNKNAKSHFDDKLMPAFEALPIFLKPLSVSGRTSDELEFNVTKNDYGTTSLQTKVVYATTASEKFFDGLKMRYLLTDESGKTEKEVNVAKRHDVNKNTVAQGNGRIIRGYMDYPSTVDEMADGSFAFRALCNTSNFYQRVPSTGQTKSGLFLIFKSALDGLDGFVDSYGISIKDELLDYQKREGHKQTAFDYLQGKMDALIKEGDSDSMRLYREEKKLFPIKFSDCWLGDSGDLGFNLENIDARLAELRRHSDVIRGNFHWVSGEFGGEVEFREDNVGGRFLMSQEPYDLCSNTKVMVSMFSTFEGAMVNMWRPSNPGVYTLGCDPFNFGNKQQTRIGVTKGTSSRLSDGGIAIYLNYDPTVDGERNINEWKTGKFVLSYRHKPANTDAYNEDVLKAAVYFGAMVFPEINIPTTYEYFIKHKFGGYLLYDIDKYTNRFKDKPGVHQNEATKQHLFALLRDYIEDRCHQEDFMEFLQECKEIKGMEEMRYYDRLTAHGMALMGANSTYVNTMKNLESKDYDVSDFNIWV